ncbi:enoyl-CoA hydratase [Bradyrhizobium centrolobii]|uniref:Enoyl-CoA hydratase n=1 Tax=Bradyrhizobium centrolobii TaxID=1505087 RepID=A0A176YZW3_9BRAD|nr:enoyl-CoA hydratase/isomerase family protein [Bradyrhizobium centrolobii]OAF12307.1 enoyl-CoA hydratase [Bradyrhizobium centrolobii]
MSSKKLVLVERQGKVGIVSLNRPERLNALSQALVDDLSSELRLLNEDNNIRAIVLTGAGDTFSSGFDLKEQMETRPTGVADWRTLLRHCFDGAFQFWRSPKPTIAAVRGHCLAGAFELALCCDMTVAAEDSVFGEPELKFGAGIIVMMLPFMVNPKRAKEIIFLGRDQISAREALDLGLVNRIVPAASVLDTAIEMANTMAVIDPMVVGQTKRAINKVYDTLGLGLALESALDIDMQIEGQGSVDKKQFMEIARSQGMRAAFQWRDARFQDVSSKKGGH